MPFVNENIGARLPQNAKFQKGVSNRDQNFPNEGALPWVIEPEFTWLYYDTGIETYLDSGAVVHRRLPQENPAYSTLGHNTPDKDKLYNDIGNLPSGLGVNLDCKDQFKDIQQRMGHSHYWFRLWGQALRFGYQIPIPKIVKIAGVEAIPYDKNPQWAYNRILTGVDYGGVLVWHAQWSLWYTILEDPAKDHIEPELVRDPVSGASGKDKIPQVIQAPFGVLDDNFQRSGPRPDTFRIPFQE